MLTKIWYSTLFEKRLSDLNIIDDPAFNQSNKIFLAKCAGLAKFEHINGNNVIGPQNDPKTTKIGIKFYQKIFLT